MRSYTDNLSSFIEVIRPFIKRNRYHLVCWAFFLFYEVVVVGLYNGHFSSFWSYLVHYGLNIGLFYFHANVMLTFTLKNIRQSFWRVPMGVIMEIAIYVGILYAVQLALVEFTALLNIKSIALNVQFVLGSLFRACYFIVFSTGYYFLSTYLKEKQKTDTLQKHQLENLVRLTKSENAYLRAQINPHFLFNTLNFIYHNAKHTAPVAAESISALSSMMRYSIDHTFDEDFAEISQEIEQVENLINLHQLRENHQLQIHLDFDEDLAEYRIIPLILSTLVENIFKHGNLRDAALPARLSLEINQGALVISAANVCGPARASIGLGSGIQNITRRLQYVYGSDHEVRFGTDCNGNYNFSLRIKNFLQRPENKAAGTHP